MEGDENLVRRKINPAHFFVRFISYIILPFVIIYASIEIKTQLNRQIRQN